MKKILFSFLLISTIVSCKKEKTSWDSQWTVPIVHGELTTADLAYGNTVSENTNGFASLFFEKNIFSFSLDTILKLKDTTLLHKSFSSIPTFDLTPGNSISTPGIDKEYDFGDIQLKQVMIKEGKMILRIESPWQGKTTLNLKLPNTKDGSGQIFDKNYDIPEGTISNPAIITKTIDLTNFDFDLTGSDGSLLNNITADLIVSSAEETDNITVTNIDTVYISMEFIGLVPKYAKGYLGEHLISDTTTISIPQLKAITGGSINLDSINLGLSIENSFKLFNQATISLFKGKNTTTNNEVSLAFPQLNSTLNINTASGGLYNYVASVYNLPIHSGNSNIIPFIENLPNSVDIGYTIHINPYGNSSGGNDEYFPNSSFELNLNGDFPLELAMNDLTLVDTFDIKFDQNKTASLNKGSIVIAYQNKFPLGAKTELVLLNNQGLEIETITALTPILPGTYNSTTNQTTATSLKSIFELNENSINNLDKAKKMILRLKLSSDQTNLVKINMAGYFKFNLFSDLNIKVKL